MAATFDAFAAFDANAAKCFKPEDKEALLSVIESGTGSIDAFNNAVRDMFASIRTPHAQTHVDSRWRGRGLEDPGRR